MVCPMTPGYRIKVIVLIVTHILQEVTGVRRYIYDGIDPVQRASLNEMCYAVDEEDKIIGTLSKKDCHLVQGDGYLPLHRAFSVYVFNNKGEFLMQKRASTKVTYPNYYSNSCCSHPIADIPGEDDGAEGIKRAARRRLHHELGIPLDQIPTSKFNYMTRYIYKDIVDEKWGEYELAYMLILQGDFDLNPNPNEIGEIVAVKRSEIDTYVKELKEPITPWFSIVYRNWLKNWWDNLNNTKVLDSYKNHDSISKF